MRRIRELFKVPPQALPASMLNLLIEVDNREGLRGLLRLERDIRSARARLQRTNHPQSERLVLWLKALEVYRQSYYPRPRWLSWLTRPAGEPRRRARAAQAG